MWNNTSTTRSPPAALAISGAIAGPTPRSVVNGSNSGASSLAIGSAEESVSGRWFRADMARIGVYDTAQMSLPETPLAGMGVLDVRRRRLLFRATHRGTHEADLLVGGFVAPRIAAFSDAELDAVEAVLELPDTWLADWMIGRRSVPAEYDSPMLRAMCEAVGQ
jgi:antitoxin CptB